MRSHFEVFEDAGGEWRWRLQARNGEIIAASEGYGDRAKAVQGAKDATKVMLEAVAHSLVLGYEGPVELQNPASRAELAEELVVESGLPVR